MSIVRINSEEDFEKFKDVWLELQTGEEMTFFQSYQWNLLLFRQWKKDYISNMTSYIAICYTEDNSRKINMIVPVVIQKFSNFMGYFARKKGIYFLGVQSYSDYLNFIYSEFLDESVNNILKQLEKLKMPIYFNCVREDVGLCRYLKSHSFTYNNDMVYVAVSKEDKFENYYANLSKHTRQNIRTAINRAAKDSIDYKVCHMGMIKSKRFIDELVKLHKERVYDINKREMMEGEHSKDFVRKIYLKYKLVKLMQLEKNNNIIAEAMNTIENSWLLIVYIEDKMAGYLYGVVDRNVIRIMQNCYRKDFARYSPLFRACYDIIKKLYEDENSNINVIDFTRGTEPYKYMLGGKEGRLYDFTLRN